MHPNAKRWVERHLRTEEAERFRQELEIFLGEVLGPLLGYNFRGLTAGYPYLHIPIDGVLYLRYVKRDRKPAAFQLIGRALTEGTDGERRYRKALDQYNKLSLDGWAVLGFTSDNLADDLPTCREFVGRMLGTGVGGGE